MTKKKESIKPETFERRRETFFQRMENGAALIPNDRESRRADGQTYPFYPDMDFFYLTGIDEPNSAALFLKNGSDHQFILFVQPRDPEQETWDGSMIGLEQAREQYGADEALPSEELESQLPDFLEGHRRVYFPLSRYDHADEALTGALKFLRENVRNRKRVPEQVLDLSNVLHPMRLKKTPEEIHLHRRAIDITWKGLMRALEMCEPGRFEYELEATLNGEYRRRGADGPAFETIVAGGNNATVLHYTDNEDRLHSGDLALIDTGASYQYHCADVTRTVPINGSFSEPQRAFYKAVLDCQKEIIQHVQPGISYDELQNRTVRLLTKSMTELGLLEGEVDDLTKAEDDQDEPPYKQFFMHKIGHWLGLDVHDVGAYREFGIDDPEATKLQPGMLLTIEPGLYVPADSDSAPSEFTGTGVRIEDDVLVTEDGCEVLTREIPKEIEDVEELLE